MALAAPVLVIQPEGLATVWPLSGLAVAALRLRPRSEWLAYGLLTWALHGLASALAGHLWPAAAAIAAARTAAALGAAWTLGRMAPGQLDFAHPRHVLALAAVASGPTMLTALPAIAWHTASGGSANDPVWLTWWMADGLGIVLVTPWVITWAVARQRRQDMTLRHLGEAAVPVALLLGAAWYLFIGQEDPAGLVPWTYATLSLLVWATWRSPQGGAPAALGLLAVVALTGLRQQTGPFAPAAGGAGRDVLTTQALLAVVSLATLTLAALRQTQTAAAAQLQRSQQVLITSQHLAHLGHWTWHVQANRLEWSPEMHRIFGIDPAGFSGDLDDVVARAIHPDDRATVDRANQAVRSKGKPQPLEYRVIRPDGTVRVVWAEAGELTCDAQGRPAVLTGIVQDITDQKRVIGALRESQARLGAIIEATGVGLWTWDLGSGHTYYSPEWKRQLGYADHEIGSTADEWQSRLHPEDREATLATISTCAAGAGEARDIEYRLRHRDGSYRWVLCQAALVRDEWNQPLRLQGLQIDVSARRAAEEGLRRYELLAAHSRDIILFIDRQDGRIVEANAAAANAYGYERDELLRRRVHDLRDSSDAALTAAQMAQADSVGITFQTRHQRRDGTPFPVEVSSRGATKGGQRLLVSVIRDISERRQAEEALRLSEEKFSRAFAANPAALALVRREDGVLLEVNDTWVAMVGHSRQQALGASASELSLWASREAATRFEQTLRRTGMVRGWEETFRRQSGELFVAQVWASVLTVGQQPVVLLALVDISERVAAEERFRQAFQASPDPMFIVDQDSGQILQANASFAVATGHAPRDAVGATAEALGLWADPAVRAGLAGALREHGQVQSVEAQFRRQSGEVFDGLCTAWLTAFGGRPCVVSVIRDISQQKRLEREVDEQRRRATEADRLRALGEMAAGVAHELRQPLNGIRTFSEGLLYGIQAGWETSPREYQEALQQIIEQVDRMATIIDHTRVFARDGGASEAECFGLAEVVQGGLTLMGAQLRVHDIQLAVSVADDLPQVRGHREQVEQVLLNLLSNARDALDARRQTGAERGWHARIAITSGTTPTGDGVWLAVNDNGGGLPPQAAPRAFEPFFTTKEAGKGTGLGLSISRRIASEHGGRLELANRPGDGAQFTLVLPIGAEPDLAADAETG
jgi:PAS domain S-box-containing protein